MAAPPSIAEAHDHDHAGAARHHHHHHTGRGHEHGHAAQLRYGGAPERGYWRPGPHQGYGFGFATYRGDPFGKSDYFDGRGCFYLRAKDFCIKEPPRGIGF
jgi:hypothetical protein